MIFLSASEALFNSSVSFSLRVLPYFFFESNDSTKDNLAFSTAGISTKSKALSW